MPIKPYLEIKGQDWSKVFMSVHMDRNLENQDADRATIKLANPYGKLTGIFTRGNIVRMRVTNIVRSCNRRQTEYEYKMFTGNIYTIQDGPRQIEIVATCKISSLNKNMPNGLLNHEGWDVKQWVTFIIDEFNKIASDWEKIEVAEIWDSPTIIKKDQMTNGGDITFLDALDACCNFSGGFYYFDDDDKFHFSDPAKPRTPMVKDITPISTNPVACYTQIGYHNVQTVICSSENDPGHHPSEQDRHAPVMATYVSPAVESGEESKVIAPPLYLPYVTTEAEALSIAKNMVANFAQYMNATQDLELVNAIIQPLDQVTYATGLRYYKGKACGKIIPVPPDKQGKTEGLVRRAVCDLSSKGWRQKLETCAPPSQSEEDSQSTNQANPTLEIKQASPVVKTYGQPPYGWTKDGYGFFYAKQDLYDQMKEELKTRGIPEGPNTWIYVNPDAFDPNAPSRSWLIYRFGQDDVPPAGMKMVEPWDTRASPGDVDGNNAFVRG